MLNWTRAQEQEVELEPNALSLLTKIGQETSLRYASHLITASNMIASKRPSQKAVNQDDVSRSYRLFIDTKRSVDVSLKYLQPFVKDVYLFCFSICQSTSRSS